MSTLVTFPGRAGDLLWALPTVRALSEQIGEPVDLQIAGEFSSMLTLLRQQPYLGHVCANPHWGMANWDAPMPVGTPEGTYDRVLHLGYRRWPECPLPFETQETLRREYGVEVAIDLGRPWIEPPGGAGLEYFNPRYRRIATGWSDCYFELKYGLQHLMDAADISWQVVGAMGPGRWFEEGGESACTWMEATECLAQADVFLGDCSALHVLAVALGKPVILMEPMEARWNDIFYPLGKTGRVRLVTGNDGQPTFDARHVADVLKEALGG